MFDLKGIYFFSKVKSLFGVVCFFFNVCSELQHNS